MKKIALLSFLFASIALHARSMPVLLPLEASPPDQVAIRDFNQQDSPGLPLQHIAIFTPVEAEGAGLSANAVNTPAGGHSVALTCTPPTTGDVPDSYEFSRSVTTGGPYTVISIPNPTTCAYTDADQNVLLGGKTFFYVAKSVKQTQKSGPSNEVAATIPFLLNPPIVQNPVVQ